MSRSGPPSATEADQPAGPLALGHVHRVVDRDDAHEFLVAVDDRQSEEVVFGDLLRDELARVLDPGGDHLAAHDLADRRLVAGDQEVAQRDHAHEPAGFVDHVGIVDRLLVGGLAAELGDRLGDRELGRERRVVRGRDRAGAAFGVGSELADVLPLGGGERRQERLVFGLAQAVEQIGALVVGHRRDDPGELAAAEARGDRALHLRLQEGQDVGCLPLVQRRQHAGGFRGRHAGEDRCRIRRVDGGKGDADRLEIVTGEELGEHRRLGAVRASAAGGYGVRTCGADAARRGRTAAGARSRASPWSRSRRPEAAPRQEAEQDRRSGRGHRAPPRVDPPDPRCVDGSAAVACATDPDGHPVPTARALGPGTRSTVTVHRCPDRCCRSNAGQPASEPGGAGRPVNPRRRAAGDRRATCCRGDRRRSSGRPRPGPA